MHLPNRLAVEGEDLITHRFQSGSIGLASPADLARPAEAEVAPRQSFWEALKKFFTPAETCPVPAVCIPPSTRLQLHSIGERLRREYHLQSEEEVIFEQITAEANTYRDAVRFRSGKLVRLQELPEGQRIRVIDMSVHELHPQSTGMEAASRQSGDLLLQLNQ